jgi:hypothetical protein
MTVIGADAASPADIDTLGITAEFIRQDFDGYFAFKLRITGPIHAIRKDASGSVFELLARVGDQKAPGKRRL